MGKVRLIYDETTNQFKEVGFARELNTAGTRKILQGALRYCLHGNRLFLPKDQTTISDNHRLCWGLIRSEELDLFPYDLFDIDLPINPLNVSTPFYGIGFGTMYSKRHYETKEGRIPVRNYISQNVIDNISENPEVLLDVNKDDFESLMAEIFARMGFDVDLYRSTKDDGIDFLATRINDKETKIFCVQCKHPDKAKNGRKRKALSVATVRELYGVAKANNLNGCLAISSSRYSNAAKKFSELKSEEIKIADEKDVINWVKKYRWEINE